MFKTTKVKVQVKPIVQNSRAKVQDKPFVQHSHKKFFSLKTRKLREGPVSKKPNTNGLNLLSKKLQMGLLQGPNFKVLATKVGFKFGLFG